MEELKGEAAAKKRNFLKNSSFHINGVMVDYIFILIANLSCDLEDSEYTHWVISLKLRNHFTQIMEDPRCRQDRLP